MTGVENTNGLHHIHRASMSLPQEEEEEREELEVEVSPRWMESIAVNILVKRSLSSSITDHAIALTLGAGPSPMFLLLALPSI